jgi:hypothetical protein
MLARYKKPGGFLQLLSLIESFGAQKREKFMEMIHAEDPVWADALKTKMLSIERLFKWPEQTVTEIFRTLPTKNLVCVIKGTSKENSDKILKYLSHAEKRKLEDEMGTLEVKPDDIFASFVRVIEMTRKMIKEGDIRLDKIDTDLMIPDGFEEKLAHAPGAAASHGNVHTIHSAEGEAALNFDTQAALLRRKAENGELDSKLAAEFAVMQKSVAALSKENAALKEELRHLKDKLDQIRRIA